MSAIMCGEWEGRVAVDNACWSARDCAGCLRTFGQLLVRVPVSLAL